MDGPLHSLLPPGCDALPPDPMRGLVKEVLRELSLQEDELLVDLSCGDGRFAEAVLAEVSLRWQIIGVQASPELLLAGTGHVGIRPVPMDLEAFARFPVRYHKALLHWRFSKSGPADGLFARILHQLIPGGRLVVVGSAPGDDVPLPTTAVRRWTDSQLASDGIADALEAAGFSPRIREVRITCHTPAAECLDWVASRAWPMLRDVPEAELADGLAELRERLGGHSAVTWTARFDVVTGRKAGDTTHPGGAQDGGESRERGRSLPG